jgi:cytochrome c oxidase cbb3-type subunit I/II
MSVTKKTIEYNDGIVRQFMLASIFWGVVGILVGVLVATQLAFWQVNFNIPWLTFGRLRPLHTNAVIFAFVGNMMFAGIYHSTQRLVKARLASDFLSKLHFWGWQAIIVAAAITLPLGFTRSKECAELIWPIDIAVALIWVVFAINFFWTLARRHERTLYVAIWFYIATIVTVAVLYIVNHLSFPTSLTHSYPILAACRTRSCSGGMGTTPSRSSSPRRSSTSCITTCRKRSSVRCIRIGCRSCISGRWCSSTSGPARIIC